MGHEEQYEGNQRLQLGWLIAVVLAVVLVVGYLVACMVAQSLDGTRGHWWWLWSYKFAEQGSWFDVARTTAALVAIPGAAVALAITYARHHATERQIELAAAESRALESREIARRVNEQYVQAIDQLRDDSAVARIAGMHALDRLAQEQVDLRSIVVDVWCAYLRIQRPSESGEIEAEEREVRATCTRLILGHLQPNGGARYWGDNDIRVDLSRADLTTHWDARGVRFPGETDFSSAEFGVAALFRDSTFGEDADFSYATFGRYAEFDDVSFGPRSRFWSVEFGEKASFRYVRFGEDVWLDYAVFGDEADFEGARFVAHTDFDSAMFGDRARFVSTSFGDVVRLDSAVFGVEADFTDAVFGDDVTFDGAVFSGRTPRGDGTWWLHEQPNLEEPQDQEDAVLS